MKIEHCSYEVSKELHSKSVQPLVKITHYWVDMSAWGRGYELMPKDEAEYRGSETKWTAFIDFDSTIPAYTVNDTTINK